MSTFATALKEEIRRLARSEIRAEIATIRKASTQHRKDIAALKRTIHNQDRQLAALRKSTGKSLAGSVPADTEAAPAVRFSGAWLAKHRGKLSLSAADYAVLVGVSPLTIYNWEKGKTRPRASQLLAWSKIRNLGKREAWALLEEME